VLDHISWSQINTWQRCPRQWYYRYVMGLKMRPSGALIEGSCYHTALEVNFKQKVTSKEDLPISDCLDVFSGAWEARVKQEESIDWEDEEPGKLKDEGIWLVRTYLETTSPSVQPVEVEKPYVRMIGSVPAVGVVDLTDIKERVIDHKTSNKMYQQEDVDKDDQITTYAFLKNRAIVGQVHVAVKPTKTLPPRIIVMKTFRTDAHIKWWLDMVTGILEQMKTGNAPPRPYGWWCSPRFCGYYDMCRGNLPT